MPERRGGRGLLVSGCWRGQRLPKRRLAIRRLQSSDLPSYCFQVVADLGVAQQPPRFGGGQIIQLAIDSQKVPVVAAQLPGALPAQALVQPLGEGALRLHLCLAALLSLSEPALAFEFSLKTCFLLQRAYEHIVEALVESQRR